MHPIGGFFESEKDLTGSQELHPAALRVSLGRGAFRLVLETLRPKRVWMPFYICKVMPDTLDLLSVPYEFYHLNEKLEPAQPLAINEGQCAVVINYFGLQGKPVGQLGRKLGKRLVVDNTQAFFDGPCAGAFSLNSARKFFGVPDGSYLFSPVRLDKDLPENLATSMLHLTKRAEGDLAAGYAAFQAYENSLKPEVQGMSRHSRKILGRIDYPRVRERRRKNFVTYQKLLGSQNLFRCELDEASVPFCYPFVPKTKLNRTRLHERGIFVPTLWPEISESADSRFAFERDFSQRLLPLPLDQRYGEEDIRTVVDALQAIHTD